MLLEILTESDNFFLEWTPTEQSLIAGDILIDEERLASIISFLEKVELIQREGSRVSCENLTARMSPLIARRERDRDRKAPELPEIKKDAPTVKKAPPRELMTTEDFESFWNAYPANGRHEKKQTHEYFAKLERSLLPAILAGLEAHKKTDQWARGYIKYPQRFLKHELWKDDVIPSTSSPLKNDNSRNPAPRNGRVSTAGYADAQV